MAFELLELFVDKLVNVLDIAIVLVAAGFVVNYIFKQKKA